MHFQYFLLLFEKFFYFFQLQFIYDSILNFFIQFSNENKGSILVISVIILMLLSIIGVAAFNTTKIELYIARNDKIYKENFYLCESALHTCLADQSWLVSNSSLFNSTNMNPVSYPLDMNSDGINETLIEISRISTSSTNGTFDIPSIPHIVSPPAGSGFGMKDFEVRRYALTVSTNSTTGSGRNVIQGGCWKVFKK